MANELACIPGVRPLPHNVEAEMAVLGTLLTFDRAWDKLNHLERDAFLSLANRAIWDAICDRKKAGLSAVPTIVTDALNGALDDVGGRAYLAKVLDAAVPVRKAAELASHLTELLVKRTLIQIGEEITSRAFSSHHTVTDIIREAVTQIGEAACVANPVKWTDGSSYDCRNIEWLWPDRLVASRINLIVGMGDVGKNVLLSTIAACVTTGCSWPDNAKGCQPGLVGIVESEDDPNDTVMPRLHAASADVNKIRIWNSITTLQPQDIEGLSLLVVSPLIDIMDGRKEMNREQDMRAFLRTWQLACRKETCTVAGIAHYSKRNDINAVQRIMGASGLANFVRSTWCVERDNEDKSVRLFLRLKANLSPDTIGGLKFSIRHVGPYSQSIVCTWLGKTDLQPDDVLRERKENGAGCETGQKKAREFLKSFLSRQARTKAEVMEAASDLEIPERMLQRAAKEIGVKYTHTSDFPRTTMWSID